MNLHYVPLPKSYIDQVYNDIKDEIGRSVHFVGVKSLVKLHFKRIKLIYFAISINMVVLMGICIVLRTLQEEEWISQQDRKIQVAMMI